MKRFGAVVLSLCLFGAAGCGDDDSTSPSNLPIVMTASLSPANEVPAIANAENTGHGAVQITLNVTRDGTGAISSGTAEFHFQLSGFPSSTTIIAAHIHPGAAGVTAVGDYRTFLRSRRAENYDGMRERFTQRQSFLKVGDAK